VLRAIIHDHATDDPASRPDPRARGAGFLRSVREQLLCMTVLLPALAAVYYSTYLLRFEGQLDVYWRQQFLSSVVWIVAIKLVVFTWFRVYQGWGRLVAFHDLLTLIQAATVSLLLAVLINRIFLPHHVIPRSVFLLDWGETIVVLGGVRALMRAVRERDWFFMISRKSKPTFIVGADDAGELLLRAIRRNGALAYRVVGFIDDEPKRQGCHVAGVRIIGTLDQTCLLAQQHGVTEVLITAGQLSGRQVRKLVDATRPHGINVRVLPSYEHLLTGRVAIQPRPVDINDLLRREPVHLDMGNIRQWIDRRTVLVTGSAGSIGSEICRQLLRFAPRRIILVDRSENGQFFLERELRQAAPKAALEVCIADVLDDRRMRDIFQRYRPDIIFHAAAYKHVPLMEAHPGEAVKNILIATRQLADLAVEYEVESFVLISTDKAVNPTSVMGACKRAAELYVQSLKGTATGRFVTVRFGNVLDSAGSVVQVFRQQIALGGPVTVTDPNIERYFMTIPEASRLVIQAGAIGNDGEILVLDMGEPVRIVDLAADMIRLSGLRVGEDIEIELVGLRPGEKLFEELHTDSEKHLPTRHSHITVADCKKPPRGELLLAVEELSRLSDEAPGRIVPQLQELIPEYRRQESPAIILHRAAA